MNRIFYLQCHKLLTTSQLPSTAVPVSRVRGIVPVTTVSSTSSLQTTDSSRHSTIVGTLLAVRINLPPTYSRRSSTVAGTLVVSSINLPPTGSTTMEAVSMWYSSTTVVGTRNSKITSTHRSRFITLIISSPCFQVTRRCFLISSLVTAV